MADDLVKLRAENAELRSQINTVQIAAKYAAKIRDERIEKLEAALREVLSWVNQYSVDATYDDHWPVIEERAHKALDAK